MNFLGARLAPFVSDPNANARRQRTAFSMVSEQIDFKVRFEIQGLPIFRPSCLSLCSIVVPAGPAPRVRFWKTSWRVKRQTRRARRRAIWYSVRARGRAE